MTARDGAELVAVRRRTAQRELAAVIGVIVVAAGGVLLLTSLTWLRLNATRPAPFTDLSTAVKGRDEYPALAGLAIVALLIAILTLVTGLWVRRLLGALLAGIGLWCLVYGLTALASPAAKRQAELLHAPLAGAVLSIRAQIEVAPAASTVLLSVALAAAGLVLAARAGRWRGGLSARYAAPAEARRVDDPWRSLDRGDDPTVSDH